MSFRNGESIPNTPDTSSHKTSTHSNYDNVRASAAAVPYGSTATPYGANGSYSRITSPAVATKSTGEEAKYIPSSTCQLVRELDAGKEPKVSSLTGAEIRTAPAQSPLYNLLEKQCQYVLSALFVNVIMLKLT